MDEGPVTYIDDSMFTETSDDVETLQEMLKSYRRRVSVHDILRDETGGYGTSRIEVYPLVSALPSEFARVETELRQAIAALTELRARMREIERRRP